MKELIECMLWRHRYFFLVFLDSFHCNNSCWEEGGKTNKRTMRYFYVIVQILALHIKVCFFVQPKPFRLCKCSGYKQFCCAGPLIPVVFCILFYFFVFCIFMKHFSEPIDPIIQVTKQIPHVRQTRVPLQRARHVTSFTLYFHVILFVLGVGFFLLYRKNFDSVTLSRECRISPKCP